ncbi:MAG: CCA tRNA nucleotidyltransferase [Thermoleophilaceae bacterium]|nr:CCA tRNA nucleotidyltransferase [Thermoleophilaceae bacterium]
MSAPGELRERLRATPAVAQLLPALEDLQPVYLVGGWVRVLLGFDDHRGPVDLAVEGDARAAARTLAARLGGESREYEQFGTATLTTPRLELDLTPTRRETYPEPGALPVVRPAPLTEDLARRDFTVNAMAVGLRGDDLGHLYDPLGGLADAAARLIRVMHPASFTDDPTRLLRAVRFETRLGFRMDEETERAAREAAETGAPATVSGPRIRDELIDLLSEVEAPAAIARLSELGIDRALHPAMRPDPELVASAALGAMAIEADRALAALAAVCAAAPLELDLWLAGLQLDARDRDVVSWAARMAQPLAAELRSRDHPPSELRALLARQPRESLALALAAGAPPEPILRWISDLSHVRLQISGADLLAEGVPEGPALGAALDATLDRKLDGLVSGREEELRTALELARGS